MAPPRSAFPAEGTRFGLHDDSFELGTELGGGSQGRVYACKRLGTGNEYAVKIVNTKAIGLRERTMASLRREISVMRELHHPRIVNLKEAFWEGNLCYIVMDLARGGDLHGKLEPGVGLGSEQSSRHVSLQLLGGIAYMHSHKVIHRDLKPENVLIVRSFLGPEPLRSEMHEVKIADFGLSKCLRRVGEQEAGMTACGTLDYLAPEVVTGQYDERIDFWSFGVLLYIMLSGRLPFEIEGVADIKRLKGESLTFQGAWRSVSEHARTFVQGLLRVEPADRFDQKGCLSHPWLAQASTTEGSVTCSDTDTSPLEIDSPTAVGGYRHKEVPAPADTLTLFGGAPTMRYWSQPRKGAVRQISGSVGNAVDCVEIQLRGGKRLFYGEQGGFQHKSSRLHHDEVILAVTQQERDSFVGNSLVFYTSECQIVAFQGHDATSRTRLIAPTGSQITGLQFEGSHLTGIYLERIPLDGSAMAIARISGHVGSAVDKLVLQLRDGSSRRYGFEGGDPVGPWTLDADEYVLLVEQDRRDAYLGNSLAFVTSKGNIIEFRGLQASRSRRFVAPPDRQICGLGFTGSCLTRVTTCPLEAHETGEQNLREHSLHVD
ncbi:unnamed protein product [Symbiodinium sp. CCMP2456]|nr:unnamed protein product [Symbiodinium sp. CCMP2456]